MSGGAVTPYAELLAHHALVQALPGVIPMVVLVGTFVGIVVVDRRKHRRDRDAGPGQDGADSNG